MPDRAMTGRQSDAGSATIWPAAVAGFLAACALAALAFGTAMLARHRAGSAADLAALAAAVHADPDDPASASSGAPDSPCAWADLAVRAQGASLVDCRCD